MDLSSSLRAHFLLDRLAPPTLLYYSMHIVGTTAFAYYSEWEPYCAEWLRNLIRARLIPPGHVDERSITDIQPEDLLGFTQIHFFTGIAGWPLALRNAGWPDSRPVWTGSCPCQPFSNAGEGRGVDDERHLWPYFHRLISHPLHRPPTVFGEQVASPLGRDWFDGVAADLEADGYAVEAVDIPACAVDAPHKRNRLYWAAWVRNRSSHSGTSDVADAGRSRSSHVEHGGVADPTQQEETWSTVAESCRRSTPADGSAPDQPRSFYSPFALIGPDAASQYRRIKPLPPPVAHGLPGLVAPSRSKRLPVAATEEGVGDRGRRGVDLQPISPLAPRQLTTAPQLAAIGNSIVVPLAAEFIRAYLDAEAEASS